MKVIKKSLRSSSAIIVTGAWLCSFNTMTREMHASMRILEFPTTYKAARRAPSYHLRLARATFLRIVAEVAVSLADSRRPWGPRECCFESLSGLFLLVHAPQHEARLLFWSRTRTPFLWPLLAPLTRPVTDIYVDLLSSSKKISPIPSSASVPAYFAIVKKFFFSKIGIISQSHQPLVCVCVCVWN